MKLMCAILMVALFGTAGPCLGQVAVPMPHLDGILIYGSNQLALLHLDAPAPRGENLVLGKAQREGDIEVVDINFAEGRVKTIVRGQSVELSFSADEPAGMVVAGGAGAFNTAPLAEPASIRLQKAGPDQVFRLYQLLSGRTLIRPAALPHFRVSLRSNRTVTTGNVLEAVEQALAQNQVSVRSEGEKFAIASKAGAPDYITSEVRDAAAALAKSSQTPASSSKTPSAGGMDILPAGVINFPNTDLNQFLIIFQELANRTMIRATTLPAPLISLRTYSPLTRAEGLFAFTAVLAANGLAVVPVGDKLMVVGSIYERQKIAALLERKPAIAADASFQTSPPKAINWPWADLNQVLDFYGKVSGRNIEIDNSAPRPRFALRTQTSLTPGELLTALDLLLGMSGLEVVPGSDSRTARLKIIGAPPK